MSDPFETLGLEPRFELDLNDLEARQRELSRALHPDRYAARCAAERRLALSRAIEVNDAARLLKDPLRRAQALLARHGIDVGEGDEQPRSSPGFLMEVLEQREELSQALRQKDVHGAERLAQDFAKREAALLSELGGAFAALGNSTSWERSAAEPLLSKLGELRFVRRLLNEAHTIVDELS
ncbi:MAG: Fe-S protein assembly co-chaperone HscB [Polyangiaceae bacterium]